MLLHRSCSTGSFGKEHHLRVGKFRSIQPISRLLLLKTQLIQWMELRKTGANMETVLRSQTITRRQLLARLSVSAAVGGMTAGAAFAQDRYDQQALLRFDWPGQVSLLHLGRFGGELLPHYYRPAALRFGAPAPEALVAEALRVRFGIGGRQPMDYALTHSAFDELAQYYGKMGGISHVATVIKALKQRHPDTLVLGNAEGDAGALGPFPGGVGAVRALISSLALDVSNEEAGPAVQMFERGGIQLGIVSLRGETVAKVTQQKVKQLRDDGAQIVGCLSDLNLAQARLLADKITGLDLIFADDVALPEAEKVKDTLIISSGAQGRFVTRFDFDVVDGKLTEIEQKLIPVFADLIAPEAQMAMEVEKARAPHAAMLTEPVGVAGITLYQAGALRSTWDDLICAALRAELKTDIALWPALEAGRTIIAGQSITREDILSVTGSIRVTRQRLEGHEIKAILERAAEAATAAGGRTGQQGRMIRSGGLMFTLDMTRKPGSRIRDLRLEGGQPIEGARGFDLVVVTDQGAENPLASDLVEKYIAKRGRVGPGLGGAIRLLVP